MSKKQLSVTLVKSIVVNVEAEDRLDLEALYKRAEEMSKADSDQWEIDYVENVESGATYKVGMHGKLHRHM